MPLGKTVDLEGLNRFLRFFLNKEAFFRDLAEAIAGCRAELLQPAQSFRKNLDAVITSVTLPTQIGRLATNHLQTEPAITEEGFRAAITQPEFLVPAEELIRQGTVGAWVAIEVLANDLFIETLNSIPDLSLELISDEELRRHFPLKNISLDTVFRFKFNLSSKMGVIFTDAQPIDSAKIMRSVFGRLFSESVPASQVNQLLRRDFFWTLFQRRNLVLHRRGIVDEFYKSNTGDEAAVVEQPIQISETDLLDYLTLSRDLGVALIREMSALFNRGVPVPAAS